VQAFCYREGQSFALCEEPGAEDPATPLGTAPVSTRAGLFFFGAEIAEAPAAAPDAFMTRGLGHYPEPAAPSPR
jgi:hypothetical protein